MYREKTIRIDLLNVSIIFVATDNLQLVKDKYNAEYTGNAVGLCISNETDSEFSYIIAINMISQRLKEGVIVHEVNHCGNMILNTLGVEPSFNNDEIECLLKEYIFNNAFEFFYGNE